MKTLRTFAAIAAASTLPALAGTPQANPVFDYAFTLDSDDILADASAARNEGEQWREYGDRMRDWAEQFSSELQGSLALTFSDSVGRGAVVKGAPYRADVVSEANQSLADGNVITHQNVNKVYRDSEGRTRQETYRKGELRSVYISDPIAGVSYVLVPGSKTAVKMARVAMLAPRAPRMLHPEGTPGNVTITRDRDVVVVDGGTPGAREEMHVRVIRTDDDKELPAPPLPPIPPIPPVPPVGMEFLPQIAPVAGGRSLHFESTAHLGKGVTTKLPPKDVEGVNAEVSQTVWTIPAGQIGNRAPINITKETWTSPELQVTLLSRYNDPRTGESVYRLAAIKRGEPSPDLFKVPDGYTVKNRRDHAAPPAPPTPPTPPAAAPPAHG